MKECIFKYGEIIALYANWNYTLEETDGDAVDRLIARVICLSR